MTTGTVMVGVDVGTTACKAGVYDDAGAELAVARVPMPWDEVETGAQIEPQRLIEVAAEAIARATRQAQVDNVAAVAAVGVTSMAETGIIVDASGAPLTSAIAWHDSRGQREADDFADELGREEFSRRTGLRLRALCSASKLRWLSRNSDVVPMARRWFNVAEWVVHGLGGRAAPELSLSSRTGWLDLSSRSWWSAPLEACGASTDLLGGDPVGAGTPMGNVGKVGTAGPEIDAIKGATLTVAGHDHLAAAVGVGATSDGDVFDSSGTAEAFIAPVKPGMDSDAVLSLVHDGVSVGWHAVEDRLAVLGAQRSGMSLQRFLDLLGAEGERFDAIDREAADISTSTLRITGTEDERATIDGIDWSPSPAKIWRAAVDATTENCQEILASMEKVTGQTQRLIVGGGWARSATVRAAKSELLGKLYLTGVDEPGCRGAALIGGIAAGVFDGFAALPDPVYEEYFAEGNANG